MSEMISVPVSDLSQPDRRSLEKLLGHPLSADQQVFVMVYSAGKVPDEKSRRAAVESIRRTLAEFDRHHLASRISQEEFEDAVNEAMDHIRPRAD